MQEQINRFEKITQQFGANTVSTSIVDEGLTMGEVVKVDGTVSGIDVNTEVLTSGMVKRFGRQYSDGLYDHYIVQDMRNFYIAEPDTYTLFNHSSINAFTNYISNDPSIISKYVMNVKKIYVIGKFFESTNSGTIYLYVSNTAMSTAKYLLGQANIACNMINEIFINNGPNSNEFGQVASSDIYLENQYTLYGDDDRSHEFDVIFELEFKRIIE